MKESIVKTDTIYISDDDHRFFSENDCLRYEKLLNKYHHPLKPRYAALTNGDGKRKHCYYVSSYEEAKELLHLVSVRIDFRGRLCDKINYNGVWLVFDENEDFCPAITIDEYIQGERECELSYRESTSNAVMVSMITPDE
jgi:hypothetical protein